MSHCIIKPSTMSIPSLFLVFGTFFITLRLSEKVSAYKGHVRDEMRLHDQLFAKDGGYYPHIIPVANTTQPVMVKIRMTVDSIVEVNAVEKSLLVQATVALQWNDYRLRWNPTGYSSIAKIRLQANKLWWPDIVLSNGMDSAPLKPHPNSLALVTNDGKVSITMHQRLKIINCNVDLTLYPFDRHSCEFMFISWSYDGYKVDLDFDTDKSIGLYFFRRGEWNAIGSNAVKKTSFYACCEEPFPSLRYYIQFERTATVLSWVFVAPAAFFALTISFVLFTKRGIDDPTAGLFSSMPVCILLILAMLKQHFASEQTPLIIVFYVFCLLVMAVFQAFCTLFNSIFSGDSKPSLGCLSCLFKMCSCFGCCRRKKLPRPQEDIPLGRVQVAVADDTEYIRWKWVVVANGVNRLLFLIFIGGTIGIVVKGFI
ncbi:acetylcholine receptor subunit alpha-type acr-16-like [Lineus longissimus]|uniref:acetylcholine receptor subunit alpha-type acr-16-like n=1 Tax=Lineus longissimus TaxID=88925 RepID=UPI002B4EDE71